MIRVAGLSNRYPFISGDGIDRSGPILAGRQNGPSKFMAGIPSLIGLPWFWRFRCPLIFIRQGPAKFKRTDDLLLPSCQTFQFFISVSSKNLPISHYLENILLFGFPSLKFENGNYSPPLVLPALLLVRPSCTSPRSSFLHFSSFVIPAKAGIQ